MRFTRKPLRPQYNRRADPGGMHRRLWCFPHLPELVIGLTPDSGYPTSSNDDSLGIDGPGFAYDAANTGKKLIYADPDYELPSAGDFTLWAVMSNRDQSNNRMPVSFQSDSGGSGRWGCLGIERMTPSTGQAGFRGYTLGSHYAHMTTGMWPNSSAGDEKTKAFVVIRRAGSWYLHFHDYSTGEYNTGSGGSGSESYYLMTDPYWSFGYYSVLNYQGHGGVSAAGYCPAHAAEEDYAEFLVKGGWQDLVTPDSTAWLPAFFVGAGGTPFSGVSAAGKLGLLGTPGAIAQGHVLSPAPGKLGLKGATTTIAQGHTLSPGPGTLGLKGSATTMAYGFSPSPGAGTLGLQGTPGALVQGHVFSPAPGKLGLQGTPAILARGHVFVPGAGALGLKGTPATLTLGGAFLGVSGAGTLGLQGTPVTLTRGQVFSPDAGALGLKGTPAALAIGHVFTTGAGALGLKGSAATVNLGAGFFGVSGAGTLGLAGTPVTMVQGHILSPDPGKLGLKGTPAELTRGHVFVPGAGALGLKGTPATLFLGGDLGVAGDSILLVNGKFDSEIMVLGADEDILKVLGDADIIILRPPVDITGNDS